MPREKRKLDNPLINFTRLNWTIAKSTGWPYIMQGELFEWHDKKASSKLKKHAVSFEIARSVFRDAFAIERLDDTTDDDEERTIIIGMAEGRLLTVVYTERGEVLRIISARKADRRKCDDYYQNQATD